MCPVEIKIIPNGEIKPFRQYRTRLQSPEEQEVNKQVLEWLQKRIIRKSCLDIASRLVAVKKKTGDYRVCVDFGQLNDIVLKDCFPASEDVLQILHVPTETASKKYTSFVIKQWLYEFNRAPFGFCNSPAYFIRYYQLYFSRTNNCRHYGNIYG